MQNAPSSKYNAENIRNRQTRNKLSSTVIKAPSKVADTLIQSLRETSGMVGAGVAVAVVIEVCLEFAERSQSLRISGLSPSQSLTSLEQCGFHNPEYSLAQTQF